MTQRSLPIWEAKQIHTYSEICAYREREYASSGPKLARKLGWELQQYAETDEVRYLAMANQTIMILTALCPEWRDLSVEIFMACFSLYQKDHGLTPDRLQESYTAILTRMAGQEAA